MTLDLQSIGICQYENFRQENKTIFKLTLEMFLMKTNKEAINEQAWDWSWALIVYI